MYETNNDTRSRRRRRKCLIIPLFHYFFYCDIFVPFSAQFFVRHQLKMCTVYYISCANCLLPLHPSYCYNFWTCFWKVNTSTITSMNVFFGCYDGKLLLWRFEQKRPFHLYYGLKFLDKWHHCLTSILVWNSEQQVAWNLANLPFLNMALDVSGNFYARGLWINWNLFRISIEVRHCFKSWPMFNKHFTKIQPSSIPHRLYRYMFHTLILSAMGTKLVNLKQRMILIMKQDIDIHFCIIQIYTLKVVKN